MTTRLLCIALLAALMLGAAGCASGLPIIGGGGAAGSVRMQSLDEAPISLTSRFKTGVFLQGAAETSIYLADVPLDDLLSGRVAEGQITHVEFLWMPKPGVTPMAASATNASIRHIVFVNGEVGVYGGAGFARPAGKVEGESIRLNLKDASLRLLESTPGFVDLLTPARLSGSFTAQLDARATRRVQYAVSQMVTNAMGRSLFVEDAIMSDDAVAIALLPSP